VFVALSVLFAVVVVAPPAGAPDVLLLPLHPAMLNVAATMPTASLRMSASEGRDRDSGNG
jgi:hypothetical protein